MNAAPALIPEDSFYEEYKPVRNHLVVSAGFSDCMFETYGPELEHVRSKVAENKVWTILDTDGDIAIVAGFHYVNRLGYLITEKPWTTGTEEVDVDNDFS